MGLASTTTEATLSSIQESLAQLSLTLGRIAARQDQMLIDSKKMTVALAPTTTTTPTFVPDRVLVQQMTKPSSPPLLLANPVAVAGASQADALLSSATPTRCSMLGVDAAVGSNHAAAAFLSWGNTETTVSVVSEPSLDKLLQPCANLKFNTLTPTCSTLSSGQGMGIIGHAVKSLTAEVTSAAVTDPLETLPILPLQVLAVPDLEQPTLTMCSTKCLDDNANRAISMISHSVSPITGVSCVVTYFSPTILSAAAPMCDNAEDVAPYMLFKEVLQLEDIEWKPWPTTSKVHILVDVLGTMPPWRRSAFSPGSSGIGGTHCVFDEALPWRSNALQPVLFATKGDRLVLDQIPPWDRNDFSPGKEATERVHSVFDKLTSWSCDGFHPWRRNAFRTENYKHLIMDVSDGDLLLQRHEAWSYTGQRIKSTKHGHFNILQQLACCRECLCSTYCLQFNPCEISAVETNLVLKARLRSGSTIKVAAPWSCFLMNRMEYMDQSLLVFSFSPTWPLDRYIQEIAISTMVLINAKGGNFCLFLYQLLDDTLQAGRAYVWEDINSRNFATELCFQGYLRIMMNALIDAMSFQVMNDMVTEVSEGSAVGSSFHDRDYQFYSSHQSKLLAPKSELMWPNKPLLMPWDLGEIHNNVSWASIVPLIGVVPLSRPWDPGIV